MLKAVRSMSELNISQILDVYSQSIRLSAQNERKDLPDGLRIIRAEQDFLAYLREFFSLPDVILALWELEGAYVAALRIEP